MYCNVMQWHFPIASTYIWWNLISWNMYFDRRLTTLVAALLWRPTPHMVTVLYSLLDCRGGARSIWRRSPGRRWRQSWPVQTSSAEDSSPLPVTLSTKVLITHECFATKENTIPDLLSVKIYLFSGDYPSLPEQRKSHESLPQTHPSNINETGHFIQVIC